MTTVMLNVYTAAIYTRNMTVHVDALSLISRKVFQISRELSSILHRH